MDKQQVLDLIKRQLDSGVISSEELLAAARGASVTSVSPPTSTGASSHRLANVFYAIGAVVAVVGVIIFLVQHWMEIGFLGRVLVTLGIAAVTYIAGILLRGPAHRVISQIMFTISAVLSPLGVGVILYEARVAITLDLQLMVALALFVLFGFAYFLARRSILILLTLGYATWAYYVLLIKTFSFSYYNFNILKWATIIAGLAYILIAYGYGRLASPDSGTAQTGTARERASVRGILFGLGTLGVLGAGISLGGGWDIIFVAVLFAAFYASVFFRSRVMLILAALFLMAHIVKLTSRYFVGSTSWPIALVICGFIMIGIGYGTFQLNRKYLSVSSNAS